MALLVRNAPGADQHERVCHLNLELQRVVTNIRKLPGLSRFLLPSFFPDLQRAASGGPVITISASKYSCDALLVFLDRDPIHIPLQITQGKCSRPVNGAPYLGRARKAGRRELAFSLRKLWDVAHRRSPPDDSITHLVVPHRRVVLCCPLHSAGPYSKGQWNPPRLYVSSYTPTTTALVRARENVSSPHRSS